MFQGTDIEFLGRREVWEQRKALCMTWIVIHVAFKFTSLSKPEPSYKMVRPLLVVKYLKPMQKWLYFKF